MPSCCFTQREDNIKEKTESKEFVIIGNGPSGIALSYMLSGNWPYYVGQTQDEFLHARLMVEPELSLVEQDLSFLSEGLEGRSNYPVALLLDTLQKPDADLGLENPSLLEWRAVPRGMVDHVVLGRGRPGGVWQSLGKDMLTVSLGGWMELPCMSMTDLMRGRADVSTVSQYYTDYVKYQGIDENFRDFTMVTGVKQVVCKSRQSPEIDSQAEAEVFCLDNDLDIDDLSSACSSMTRRRSLSSTSFESSFYGASSIPSPAGQEPDDCDNCEHLSVSLSNWDPIINPTLFGYSRENSRDMSYSRENSRETCSDDEHSGHVSFEVTGFEQEHHNSEAKLFRYFTKNVVLATGAADTPNKLSVPGEDLPFVLHKLSQLNKLIVTGELGPHSDPVLVVGAGLSAADAIIAAQTHNINIAHVFRRTVRDPSLIFNRLPTKLYPEYHNIHKMMASHSGSPGSHAGYRPLQQAEIVQISPDKMVTIRRDNQDIVIRASYVLVLIGSLANLSFLGEIAENIGVVPGMEISRTNPVDVDVFSHQCTAVPGLYAMGPLIGDNFVRFIQGGALAITNHAQRKREKYKSVELNF